MGIKSRSAPAATDYLDTDDDTVTTLRSPRKKDDDPDKSKKKKKDKAKPVEDDLDDEDEEDEDNEPARTSSLQGGRKNAKRVMAAAKSGFADEFRFADEAALVKFPDAEPFVNYSQHWIERPGKRSFICLTGLEAKGCPLCKAGDNPRPVAAYNIIVLHEDGDVLDVPMVKALLCGPRLFNQIEAEHEGRYGPIDSNFWALSRSGKKGSYQTSVKPVKERDLEDDWQIDPAEAEKAMKKLKLYDPSIFKLPSRKELLDIAHEMHDGD
jgi:hypothetical protein